MGKLLTQEELDALLKGLSGGDIETEGPPEPDSIGDASHDLFGRKRIPDGHMPTMEIVNEKFSRACTASLCRFMGRRIDVSTEGFELVRYDEFLGKFPGRAAFEVFRQEPLRGPCLFVFEAKLISLVVDILSGGAGRVAGEFRGGDFTSTECRVIQRLLNVCLQDLEKAWSVVGNMSFLPLRSETNPKSVNIVNPSDLVMASHFKVELERDRAVMGYCVPCASLEPIREQLYGRVSSKRPPCSPTPFDASET